MISKRVYILIIFVVLIATNCSVKNTNSPQSFNLGKFESVCKVWGFLKYYHPGVAQGKIDWDQKLITVLEKLDTIKNKKHLNFIIEDLICCCEEVIPGQDSLYISGNVYKNTPIGWLNDTSYISRKNCTLLQHLYFSKRPFFNHYVSQNMNVGNLYFKNEKSYSDSIFPSKNLRLLALFRYWNIIYYFYPYHDLNDIHWESILTEYIPRLINLNDTIEYHLEFLEITAKLNDGHVWTESLPINLKNGIYSPPYKTKYIDNKVIIAKYFSDSLAQGFDLQIGDQIIELNDIPIDEIINSRKKYYSFSNTNQFYRRINEEILITPSLDFMKLLISREDKQFTTTVKPYPLYLLYQLEDRDNEKITSYNIINDSIGYINLEYLEINEIEDMMKNFMKLNKIIIDIRNYPKNVLYELSKYLNPSPKNFAKVFIPNISKPGQFIWFKTLKTGTYNPEYYKGTVILIVNEQTQSHAEFTTMCLQTAPNVLTIGSKTAGADGNVSYVYLPGDIITYFTGIGILYPDSSQTQRIGVKIDTIINPKAEDLRNNYDRLLDVAIQL